MLKSDQEFHVSILILQSELMKIELIINGTNLKKITNIFPVQFPSKNVIIEINLIWKFNWIFLKRLTTYLENSNLTFFFYSDCSTTI